MNRQKLLERIEAVEGREYKMYMLDGVPHIGIGHNIISRSLCDETLDFLGIEDESDLMTAELNDEQCEYLFYKDLDIAIADAKSVINNHGGGVTLDTFDKLSDERQDVLIDMSFNLGRPRFSKFQKMIGAVQVGDFDEAAAQILDSKAARDPLTKDRYENLAKEMRGLTPIPLKAEFIEPTPEQLAKMSIEQLKTLLNALMDEFGKRTGM